jgi:hypothetical protein
MTVFIIAYLKKTNFLKVFLVLCFFSQQTFAGEVFIKDITLKKNKKNFYLILNHEINFSGDSLLAINKGIPISIRMSLQIKEKNKFWFDKKLFAEDKFYQLRYRNLLNKYQINFNKTNTIYFDNIDYIRTNLYKLEWNLGELNLSDSSEIYLIIELDQSKLPKPLLINLNDESWDMKVEATKFYRELF